MTLKILLGSRRSYRKTPVALFRKAHQISFQASFAVIGRFILVYIHSRLSEQFLESQAGFGTTFKGTGGY
jgi:hypothetical protein